MRGEAEVIGLRRPVLTEELVALPAEQHGVGAEDEFVGGALLGVQTCDSGIIAARYAPA